MGLPGDLEQLRHLRHQGLSAAARPESVEAAFYLGQGHQERGTEEVGLDLHIVLLDGGGQCRALSAAGVQLFVQDPVGQLMGAGKAQPAGAAVLTAQGGVDQDGPGP